MSHRSVPLYTHLPGPQSCHKITWIVCKNVAPDLSPSIHPGIAKQQRLVSLQNSKTAKQWSEQTCPGHLQRAADPPALCCPPPKTHSSFVQARSDRVRSSLRYHPSLLVPTEISAFSLSPVSHLHLLWIGTIVSLQLKVTPHPQPPIRIGT